VSFITFAIGVHPRVGSIILARPSWLDYPGTDSACTTLRCRLASSRCSERKLHMPDLSFNRMREDTRSLAERLGAQTTEDLIRAASGVPQTVGAGLATAREGAQSAAGQLGQAGHDLAEGLQSVALPTTSARMAWRTGRLVGRIEGAVRLASFGVRFWWRRRRARGQGSRPQRSLQALVQWGPTVLASIVLLVLLGRWVARRAAST
jgi:hypothetical protein